MQTISLSSDAGRAEARKLVSDLKRDLRAMRRAGLDPRRFALGSHARYVHALERLVKAGTC